MKNRAGGARFTIIDGAAFVIGAAVASVHINGMTNGSLTGAGWAFLWLAFAGVALTASGPFVLLGRKWARGDEDYPRIGDRLWGMLGVPWLLTAFFRSSSATAPQQTGFIYPYLLGAGLTVVSLIALGIVWTRWVSAPPEALKDVEPALWTDRVGFCLAVAWPIQCGLGLVATQQTV